MTIQIVEVIRRSEQGITEPFICRGDDEHVYFVKGRGVGPRSLICEWIAGKLGLAIGLPIAPFSIVDVPEELLELGNGLDLTALGAGAAFGSMGQDAMELNAAAIDYVPDAVRRDVLAFDWWVRNGDRILTEHGGNPNLLWDPGVRELVVIDHNQAFDPDFDRKKFLDSHVFSQSGPSVFGDMVRRREYNERFRSALEAWDEIRDSLPEEWLFADPEMTVPADFDLDAAYQLLSRHERADFWDAP